MVIALLMVGTSIVTTSPRDQAQAADPLAEAKAQQDALEATLSAQRAALVTLKAKASTLAGKLSAAKAQLASVTAEFNRVSGLLNEVQEQVADITARLADLRAQIASLDKELQGVAIEILAQTQVLQERESLLQDHVRAAYERSQTSVLELLLSADSLDAATNQVSYMITVSDQDKQLAQDIRDLRASLEAKEETLRDGRIEVAASRD